jgi:hypothetical protein
MNQSELPPAEARRIVRRYVHDLNNIANFLHLEISGLMDECADGPLRGFCRKLDREVTNLDSVIRSLAVRFAESSRCVVAAFDVFQNWRDKVLRSSEAVTLAWEEPVSNSLIDVDFNVLVTALREMASFAAGQSAGKSATGRMCENGDRVLFEIRYPLESDHAIRPAPEIAEWERIAGSCGGEFRCSLDGRPAECVLAIAFPKSDSPPALIE